MYFKNILKNSFLALDEYYNLDWSQYLIDLVALSLVSDSMNMSSMENRTYYHFGLETIDKLNLATLYYHSHNTIAGAQPYVMLRILYD